MDFIPTSIIKPCHSVFSPLIAHLANLSFRSGNSPTRFTAAQVTPLLNKPGLDKGDPSNYRPISNLNNISKILKRLFLNRIRSHFISSPNFNPYQSAYLSHHSTETALILTIDSIYNSADLGKSTLLVSLDLSATFDIIDHSILLNRFTISFGIDGPVLNWISSYLSNRIQFIQLGQSKSLISPCTTGEPQGSVYSWISLIHFIRLSCTSHCRLSQSISTADDTQLFIALSRSNSETSVTSIQNALMSLYSWFSYNCLA